MANPIIAHCAECSQPLVRDGRTGRPSIYCGSDCKAKHRGTKSDFHSNCKHCGCVIQEQRRGKMFCSPACACRERDGCKQTRSEYLASARQKAIETSSNYFTCVNCGVLHYRKLSGVNASRGYENKYCSMSCRINAANKIRLEVDFLRGLAGGKVDDQSTRVSRIRSIVRMIARLAIFKARAVLPCLCCGQPVGWCATIPKKYCSKECSQKMPHVIASKKAAKLRRRAIERGANGGEYVNPIKVFMAAGWRCQICNKPTPQRLRGSTHKRAPELDHVIPLSKGGTHTWSNVQCACRECNGWKSDKIVIGQPNLF